MKKEIRYTLAAIIAIGTYLLGAYGLYRLCSPKEHVTYLRILGTITMILFVVGGVSCIITLIMWLLDPKSFEKNEPTKPTNPEP